MHSFGQFFHLNLIFLKSWFINIYFDKIIFDLVLILLLTIIYAYFRKTATFEIMHSVRWFYFTNNLLTDWLATVNWNWFLIQRSLQMWVERTEQENTNVETKVYSFWWKTTMQFFNERRGNASKCYPRIHRHEPIARCR